MVIQGQGWNNLGLEYTASGNAAPGARCTASPRQWQESPMTDEPSLATNIPVPNCQNG